MNAPLLAAKPRARSPSARASSARSPSTSQLQSSSIRGRPPSIDQLDRILNTRWHRFVLHCCSSQQGSTISNNRSSRKCRTLPLKFILHVMLLGLTTCTVFINNSEGATYIRTSKQAWTQLLMPGVVKNGYFGSDGSPDPNGARPFVYSVPDVLKTVYKALVNIDQVCTQKTLAQVRCSLAGSSVSALNVDDDDEYNDQAQDDDSEDFIQLAPYGAVMELVTLDHLPVDIARKGSPTSYSTFTMSVADLLIPRKPSEGVNLVVPQPLLPSLLPLSPDLLADKLCLITGKQNTLDLIKSLVALRISLNASTYNVGRLFPAGLHWHVSLLLQSVQSGPIVLKVQTEVTVPHPGSAYHSLCHTWYLWLMDVAIVLCSCWLQQTLSWSVWRQSKALMEFVIGEEGNTQDRQANEPENKHSLAHLTHETALESTQKGELEFDSANGTCCSCSSDGNASISPTKGSPTKASSKSWIGTFCGTWEWATQVLEGVSWRWKVIVLPLRQNYYLSLTVANVCNVIGALMRIKHMAWNGSFNERGGTTHKLCLSFAAAGLWVAVVRWFSQSEKMYTLARVLRRGVPRVLLFTLGCLPIMLAYALFGVVYFGDYTDRFGTLQMALVTLFSITNGDVVRESFEDVMSYDSTIGQLYMYSFVVLFIYVVLSVFIVIMEHAYEEISDERSFKEHMAMYMRMDSSIALDPPRAPGFSDFFTYGN